MPAAQAANLTPGTCGMSGSRSGAKGEGGAVDLAIAEPFRAISGRFRDFLGGYACLAKILEQPADAPDFNDAPQGCCIGPARRPRLPSRHVISGPSAGVILR